LPHLLLFLFLLLLLHQLEYSVGRRIASLSVHRCPSDVVRWRASIWQHFGWTVDVTDVHVAVGTAEAVAGEDVATIQFALGRIQSPTCGSIEAPCSERTIGTCTVESSAKGASSSGSSLDSLEYGTAPLKGIGSRPTSQHVHCWHSGGFICRHSGG
jgi:hypothetical protein